MSNTSSEVHFNVNKWLPILSTSNTFSDSDNLTARGHSVNSADTKPKYYGIYTMMKIINLEDFFFTHI